MYFPAVLFLIIVDVCTGVSAPENLCLNKKSNNTCNCYITHDTDNHRINSVAECSRNYLNYFPNPSQLGKGLNVLDLSYNQIVTLEHNNYVLSYDELRTLDLSHNQIRYINNDFFIDMSNLMELNLSYNNITSFASADVFANLKFLQRLDLSFNRLQVIEALFSPLKGLIALDLSYNDLDNVFTNTTKTLKDILSLNGDIQDLRLNQLEIKSGSSNFFQGLDKVTHLSLADNLLDNIPLVPHSVEYLDLSGNEISKITSKNMNYVSLKVLLLNRLSKLKTIERYSFYHLQELQSLSVTNCRRLTSFSSDVFGLTTPAAKWKLKRLLLSSNGLKSLDDNYTALVSKLDHVDISNNPWTCDCSLLWLKPLRDILYDTDNVKCSLPLYLRDRQFFQLADSDLPDCYPEKFGNKHHRILIPLLVVLVIILSVLVIYLIYYAPFNNSSNPERTVAPNSPYNQTYDEHELL